METTKLICKELFVPPRSSKYNAVLTGIRAIAFLWVCALHSFIILEMTIGMEDSKPIQEFTNHPLITFFLAGSYGVEIFLVLSGFFLAQDLWNQFNTTGNINIWDTLKQRLIRLYPTLIVMELFQMMNSITCPCIPELLLISTHSAGCMPSVWSTIVDFQSWLLLILIFVLMTRLKEPSSVRFGSILAGTALVVGWILIRLYRVWTEQYEAHPKLLYLPELLDVMQKANPDVSWKLGNYRSVEYETERVMLYHYVDTFYLNFFTKFGSVVVGFVLYLCLIPSSKPTESKEPQLAPLQQFLLKHNILITLACTVLTGFLVRITVWPANQIFIYLPKSSQLLYNALYRPLFVFVIFILIALITVPSKNLSSNPFLTAIQKVLSWDVWYFFGKISYAGYYWSGPVSGAIALFIVPLNLESPLGIQYVKALGVNFCYLIPLSVVTHLIVERQAIKWLRSKPSRLDPKLDKDA